MAETLLEIDGIETCYGLSQVLFGLSLKVDAGEMVALMGRNGMGKTTTIRSIMGMTPARAGKVRFAGEEVRSLPSYKIAKLGIGLVPEGRQIFPNLTVYEIWSRPRATAWAAAIRGPSTRSTRCFRGSPAQRQYRRDAVRRRAADAGDRPRADDQSEPLILDEAAEGLAPLIREEIWNCLSMLKGGGSRCSSIDDVANLSRIADRHYIIERGRTGDGQRNRSGSAR